MKFHRDLEIAQANYQKQTAELMLQQPDLELNKFLYMVV
jgi:hypothetical protein